MSAMFSLHNIRHAYQGNTVLQVDAWQADLGEHWLLLGASGSGKTSLLHILATLLTPSAGELQLAGENPRTLGSAARDRFRARHIGIVLQKLHLLGSLTVLDNLLLAQYLAGVKQDRKRAMAVLESVGIADKLHRYPHRLSQGEAQRVAVARAVINRPQLLLADEPTSSLDDRHCASVLDLLTAQARECNATLVIATHDQRIKQRFALHFELPVRA